MRMVTGIVIATPHTIMAIILFLITLKENNFELYISVNIDTKKKNKVCGYLEGYENIEKIAMDSKQEIATSDLSLRLICHNLTQMAKRITTSANAAIP